MRKHRSYRTKGFKTRAELQVRSKLLEDLIYSGRFDSGRTKASRDNDRRVALAIIHRALETSSVEVDVACSYVAKRSECEGMSSMTVWRALQRLADEPSPGLPPLFVRVRKNTRGGQPDRVRLILPELDGMPQEGVTGTVARTVTGIVAGTVASTSIRTASREAVLTGTADNADASASQREAMRGSSEDLAPASVGLDGREAVASERPAALSLSDGSSAGITDTSFLVGQTEPESPHPPGPPSPLSGGSERVRSAGSVATDRPPDDPLRSVSPVGFSLDRLEPPRSLSVERQLEWLDWADNGLVWLRWKCREVGGFTPEQQRQWIAARAWVKAKRSQLAAPSGEAEAKLAEAELARIESGVASESSEDDWRLAAEWLEVADV